MSEKMNLDTEKSERKGLVGFFEGLLRKFKHFMHVTTQLPLYLVASSILSLALVLPVTYVRMIFLWSEDLSFVAESAAWAFAFASGYFLYGFSLVAIVPIANKLFGVKLKAWRGPYYSVESVRWYIHNGLTYLARFTFLEFVTPSPISNWFYSRMGMKIGKGVTINTTWISDPSMIELGNKVTLGGSVTLVAHYGQGGLLVLAPVKIGDGCTIGLKASIMGGVVIGENAKILPHSVVMPKTVIPAGETWGGVPAQKVEIKKIYSQNKSAA